MAMDYSIQNNRREIKYVPDCETLKKIRQLQ